MTYDAIVVGAGGGGPVVAKELAEAGLRVLMLEAGPWLDPDTDFSLLEDDMGGILHGRLRWGPKDRSKPPWIRRREGAGLILQASGVGGTTLHYNGIAPRMYPAAVDADWPFPYEELVPYYERVEAFLPVQQVRDLATKDALFAKGCEATGLVRDDSMQVSAPVWRPAYNAILPIADMQPGGSLSWPDVDGCTMCGNCLVGCPHPVAAPLERKAKRATNVSYVPAAVATGRCEVVPDAFATEILHAEVHGRVSVHGVRWRETTTGETREAEARVVVLAGGSIESPRLWMNSGLPDPHDVVGRYLTMHLQDFVTGFFDREVHPNVGQITMARADFPGQGTLWSQGFGPQAFSIVMSGGGGVWWDEPTGDEPWDVAGRWYGPEAQARIARYSRSLTVAISTDDEAVADNRVTLTPPDEWPPDEHGPVPKVMYRPTAASQERQDWLARRAAEILRAAGAREVHRTKISPVFMTHIMSTMRIGPDPATSVFDGDGRAHHVDGLYVGDTSALPNGLGGPNPTLTAQALATRTADRIAAALA
ncbi:MAG TPA: GMC family oxidoreductase [Actinomycetota bacterium]|nr:GMC family oxidoreductase [Actinomycetota bacterium]